MAAAVLGVVLTSLLACPPTSIPTRHHDDGGHFLASPYGVPYEIEPTPVTPRSMPTPEVWLPLWDLDASLTEVEAQLALDDAPSWAPWIAWVLTDASDGEGATHHLFDALSSSELSAAHLAWWRSITPDPRDTLRAALERATAARTRALLTTTLALAEYASSCPVDVDVDGACRAPGTELLLRRRAIPRERGQQWIERARRRWAKLDVDPADIATRALLAELELTIATADYESMLDATAPEDLWFVVEDWRHDSGVPAWEAEYERQLARAKDSKTRFHAFMDSTVGCWREQTELYYELLWIDARSSGVALLRNARMLIAFADTLDAAGERQATRIFGEPSEREWAYVGPSQTDPIREQAHSFLERCLELSSLSLDTEIERGCRATLARLDAYEAPVLVEFVGRPRATTRIHRYGVLGPDAL